MCSQDADAVRSLNNKRYMKYVFHNKFRMIFHDQKTLLLNFKSNHSLFFFNISNLKHFAPVLELLFNKVADI